MEGPLTHSALNAFDVSFVFRLCKSVYGAMHLNVNIHVYILGLRLCECPLELWARVLALVCV